MKACNYFNNASEIRQLRTLRTFNEKEFVIVITQDFYDHNKSINSNIMSYLDNLDLPISRHDMISFSIEKVYYISRVGVYARWRVEL